MEKYGQSAQTAVVVSKSPPNTTVRCGVGLSPPNSCLMSSKRKVVESLTASLERQSIIAESVSTALHTATLVQEAQREALAELEAEKNLYAKAFYTVAGRLSTHIGVSGEMLSDWAENLLDELKAETQFD